MCCTPAALTKNPAAIAAVTHVRRGSWKNATSAGAVARQSAQSTAPMSMLTQKSVEICTSVTVTRWTVADDSPAEVNRP